MQHLRPSPALLARGAVVWLLLLGCRTTDFIGIARVNSTPIRTATRTVRPTFTPVRPTVTASPTLVPVPLPAAALPTATRAPAPRPTATHRPAPTSPPPPPPPPPTEDLYQGYYYRVAKNVCTTAPNTRAEGSVFNNGVPQNGVRVRVSGDGLGGGAAINDFITGVDPSDYRHQDPTLQGKYRLGIFEGQQNAGNWWVWIVNENGDRISMGAFFNSQDGPGCNTAYIDFAHN